MSSCQRKTSTYLQIIALLKTEPVKEVFKTELLSVNFFFFCTAAPTEANQGKYTWSTRSNVLSTNVNKPKWSLSVTIDSHNPKQWWRYTSASPDPAAMDEKNNNFNMTMMPNISEKIRQWDIDNMQRDDVRM